MIPWEASAALDAQEPTGIRLASLRESVEAFDRLPTLVRGKARIICSEHVDGRRWLESGHVEDLVTLLDYNLLSAISQPSCAFAGPARIDRRAVSLADIKGRADLSNNGKRIPWEVGAAVEGVQTPDVGIETLRDAVEFFDTLPPDQRRMATIQCDTLVFGKEILGAEEIEELVALL